MNSRFDYSSFLDLYLADDEWVRPVVKRNDKYIQKLKNLENARKRRVKIRVKPASKMINPD